MNISIRPGLMLALAASLLAGCSSSPPAANPSKPAAASSPAAPPAAKPTDAELGHVALQKTFIAAHFWQPDAMTYEEHSQPTQEAPGEGGRSAVWTASFGSARSGLGKTFTWSGTDAEDAPARGIGASPEDTFSASNSSTHTFDLLFLKADSDKAFAVAQAHGGKRLTARKPALPIAYRLGWELRDNALEWHVMYGGSSSPQLTIAVNATTGLFIRKEE